METYIVRFFQTGRSTGRVFSAHAKPTNATDDDKVPEHVVRRVHLQGQGGHQRGDGDQARGEEKTGAPGGHVRDVSQHDHAQNGTDEQGIANARLHLRWVAGFAQQFLEDDICGIGQLVLEPIAEVGDILSQTTG